MKLLLFIAILFMTPLATAQNRDIENEEDDKLLISLFNKVVWDELIFNDLIISDIDYPYTQIAYAKVLLSDKYDGTLITCEARKYGILQMIAAWTSVDPLIGITLSLTKSEHPYTTQEAKSYLSYFCHMENVIFGKVSASEAQSLEPPTKAIQVRLDCMFYKENPNYISFFDACSLAERLLLFCHKTLPTNNGELIEEHYQDIMSYLRGIDHFKLNQSNKN